MEFHREILGEWIVDKEYETYVDSWMVYYRTANLVDGHIKSPQNLEEYVLLHLAVARGGNAQRQFLIDSGIEIRKRNKVKWDKAKKEAQRRLDK